MHTSSLFYGSIITPHSRCKAKYLPRALLYVEDGAIKWIEEEVSCDSTLEEILRSRGLCSHDVRRLRKGEFLLPGFIDTHTHAPQFPIMGRGGQVQLLDWLKDFVYPAESNLESKDYAEKVYPSVVRRTLDCGTTTCCYFGTTHLAANKILADAVKSSGQRGFIGHCNMDREAPKHLIHSSVRESLETTRDLISYVESLCCPLVRPIITPRFAIACTDDLLRGLGDLAGEGPHLLPIQTHIAENVKENERIKTLFPEFPNYASVYDGYGLLGPTTILGHGCHLSPEEIALIKRRKAGISHCPTSNFNLSSGVAKVGEWLDENVKVGLGTDVSGGFSASMLTAINLASMASKVHSMEPPVVPNGRLSLLESSSADACDVAAHTTFANRPLPIPTLLYLATLGGAELCNLEVRTGSLTPGKVFDALLVDVRPEAGNPSVWWELDSSDGAQVDRAFLEASLERLFFCGDDRNISAVWVEGRLVGGKRSQIHNHTA